MKDAFYFPHDANAHADPKMCALIARFGYAGYGLWWTLVERMHDQAGGRFEKFPDFYKGLAFSLQADEALLQALFTACINDFRLLKEDETHVWSDRVVRNLEERDAKRMKKIEAGRIGGILSGRNRSKTKQNEAPLEENEPKESKRKESIRPTLDEVRAYCGGRENRVDPDKWFAYYESNGWRIGKNPMKNWKAAVHTWEKSQFNQPPASAPKGTAELLDGHRG